MKDVQPVSRKDVPIDANEVNGHVIYRVKQNDDDSLKLKA